MYFILSYVPEILPTTDKVIICIVFHIGHLYVEVFSWKTMKNHFNLVEFKDNLEVYPPSLRLLSAYENAGSIKTLKSVFNENNSPCIVDLLFYTILHNIRLLFT